MKNLSIRLKPFLVIFFIVGAVLLSLFQQWEPSVETWGYWYFARVLVETKQFIFMERSPLYVLYLTLFRWFEYPTSMDIEYIVTTCIASFTVFIFARQFFHTPLALLAAILWIPYMQVSEPPPQKLALAVSIFAVLIRQKQKERLSLALSYAFLIMAYMLRTTYSVLLALFVLEDLIKLVRKRAYTRLVPRIRSDWPILGALCFYILVHVAQSSHPWSNIWFASATWFPYDGKKFEIIPSYNIGYIQKEFASIAVPDFYFTNVELFNGAKDTWGAIVANPTFVLEQMRQFFVASIPMVLDMTIFPHIPGAPNNSILFGIGIILFLLWGAIATALKKGTPYPAFLLGLILMIFLSITFLPNRRYFFPLIPLFIMSAYWYARLTARLIGRIVPSRITWPFVGPFMLIVFSCLRPLPEVGFWWNGILENAVTNLGSNTIQLMTNETYNPYSSANMRRSYGQLTTLIRPCKGVLALESTFVGAFLDLPLNRVYDVWEIPPFGSFGNSEYKGLSPERIDCVLVSDNLKLTMGMPTNYQIRYQHYIQPYTEHLVALGATITDVPGYGQMFILQSKL